MAVLTHGSHTRKLPLPLSPHPPGNNPRSTDPSILRRCSLPLSVGLHKEEKGSDDIRRICVIINLPLITHVTNKRVIINNRPVTYNITWGWSQRLLQWGLSLSCSSSWSWSACSLHSIRQVSLSFIQTLRARFKCSLRMWGSWDIYIALLQLLLQESGHKGLSETHLLLLCRIKFIHVFIQDFNNILSKLSFQFLWWYQFLFLGVLLHFQFSLSHRVIPNTDNKNLFDFRCCQFFRVVTLSLTFHYHKVQCATITAPICS